MFGGSGKGRSAEVMGTQVAARLTLICLHQLHDPLIEPARAELGFLAMGGKTIRLIRCEQFGRVTLLEIERSLVGF